MHTPTPHLAYCFIKVVTKNGSFLSQQSQADANLLAVNQQCSCDMEKVRYFSTKNSDPISLNQQEDGCSCLWFKQLGNRGQVHKLNYFQKSKKE